MFGCAVFPLLGVDLNPIGVSGRIVFQVFGDQQRNTSTGDALERFSCLYPDWGVEGFPEGTGRFEVKFVNQLTRIVAKHFMDNPAGGFTTQARDDRAAGDEFRPTFVKIGIVSRGFDKNDEFVHRFKRLVFFDYTFCRGVYFVQFW